MHAIIKGSSAAPEANLLVGKMWLDLACNRIAFRALRVDSKANIADGPTRDDFKALHKLNARFDEPVFPEWVRRVWQ